jgi:glycerophosphoryl diester phosphodiesterase
MKVIGHRGAAGLTLENTLASFELAKLLGTEIIELDVRLTKDHQIVVCHDSDLERISPSNKKVADLTYAQLEKILLYDYRSRVPLLTDVLKLLGSTRIIIELKDVGMAQPLLEILDKFYTSNATIASFKLDQLALLKNLRPELKLYGLERTKPFDIIHLARILKLDGIGLNFWLLNPLTYWMAKRANLEIFVYTVNNRYLGRFLNWFYRDIAICTDHPEWFVKHTRPLSPKKSSWQLNSVLPPELIKNKSKDVRKVRP